MKGTRAIALQSRVGLFTILRMTLPYLSWRDVDPTYRDATLGTMSVRGCNKQVMNDHGWQKATSPVTVFRWPNISFLTLCVGGIRSVLVDDNTAATYSYERSWLIQYYRTWNDMTLTQYIVTNTVEKQCPAFTACNDFTVTRYSVTIVPVGDKLGGTIVGD